jgi:hypothetical protein
MKQFYIKIFILLILLNFINTLPLFSQDTDWSRAEAEIEAELRWLRAEAVLFTEIPARIDAELIAGAVLFGDDLKARDIRPATKLADTRNFLF